MSSSEAPWYPLRANVSSAATRMTSRRWAAGMRRRRVGAMTGLRSVAAGLVLGYPGWAWTSPGRGCSTASTAMREGDARTARLELLERRPRRARRLTLAARHAALETHAVGVRAQHPVVGLDARGRRRRHRRERAGTADAADVGHGEPRER